MRGRQHQGKMMGGLLTQALQNGQSERKRLPRTGKAKKKKVNSIVHATRHVT